MRKQIMRARINKTRRADDLGFTLVEVLAALLVFSFAIIGLTHAGTQSAQAVSVISEKSLAGIVADNALVKSHMRPIKLGSEKGADTQMGQEFLFAVTTAKTQDPNFFAVNVTVRKDGFEQVIISRKSFRGAP